MRDGLNGSPEVGIDHLMMLDVSPPDLVSVAREAGFDLVGLRVVPATLGEEPWPMTPDGPMLEETARRLDDTGVEVLGVEVVRIGPGTRREDYEQALEAGSLLRARYVTVNVDDPDIERACEAFATLTDDARPAAPRRADTLHRSIESGGGGPHRQTFGRRWDPSRHAPLPTLRRQHRPATFSVPGPSRLCAALRWPAGYA